jgi:adenylate cyclase
MSDSRRSPISDKTQTLWSFVTDATGASVAASRVRAATERFQEAFRNNPIDFAAEGLLEGTDDPEARADLLRQLSAAGVPLNELREAVAQDRLALLPVEAVLRQGEGCTLEQMAMDSGLDRQTLERRIGALGLGFPEPDAIFHGDARAAAVALRELQDAGLSDSEIQELCRVSGRCLQSVADSIREVFGQTFIQSGDSERDLGLRYAAAAKRMIPVFEPLIEFALTMQLLQLIRSDVVSQAERAVGRLPGGHDVAVCFADLADFTTLGETVSAEELGRLVRRFEALVQTSTRSGVRHVKTVGDATMLVAEEPAAVLDVAVALIEGVDGMGDGFPKIHAGIAVGHAVTRNGDWYGRPVNLASRLAECAPPGQIYVTEEVCKTTSRPFGDVGQLRPKGLNRDVHVFCLDPGQASD